MPAQFVTRRRVEFRDTDMAGIVHFSVFFVYMEQAEHEFLRKLGLGVEAEIEGQHLSWPRVGAQCDYKRSITFEDEIEVHTTLERIGKTSVRYRHMFYFNGELVANGTMSAVCCRFQNGQRPQPVDIPAQYRDAFTTFLSSPQT